MIFNLASLFVEIRRILTTVSLAVITIVGTGCTPPSSELDDVKKDNQLPIVQAISAPVVSSDLLASFERAAPSDIVYVLNEVKASPIDFEVIQTISCAYSRCDAGKEEWNWDALSKPLVRINLIDVLLQAKNRGIDTIDENELKSDVVALLSEPNPLVVQQCLLVLSHLDDPQDAPLIAKVANDTTNKTTFRVAVLALTLMTGDEPVRELSNTMQHANDEQKKAVADLFNRIED